MVTYNKYDSKIHKYNNYPERNNQKDFLDNIYKNYNQEYKSVNFKLKKLKNH